MLCDSWSSLLRIAVVRTLAYVALAAVLRISGKQTLSKPNAFDLVVTVALGSTPATVLLNRSAHRRRGGAGRGGAADRGARGAGIVTRQTPRRAHRRRAA